MKPDPGVLITGVAGFIGFHVARALLKAGRTVSGIDDLNDYYDPALKQARLDILERHKGFSFTRGDIADDGAVRDMFARHRPGAVIHLAAQAGVRHSLSHPRAYISANLNGFYNILQAATDQRVAHMVYASSSSVYGANTARPYSLERPADHPVSLYAATKRANELIAHSYAHLYRLPLTGLRFFTVYGPWGRPDMAYFLFTRAILAGDPIKVFNKGRMARDFTYIDDVVAGVLAVLDAPPTGTSATQNDFALDQSSAPWRLYNIGNNQPCGLMEMITLLEQALGKSAQKQFVDMQPGDVVETFADIGPLARDFGFRPRTGLKEGLNAFAGWYRDFYSTP